MQYTASGQKITCNEKETKKLRQLLKNYVKMAKPPLKTMSSKYDINLFMFIIIGIKYNCGLVHSRHYVIVIYSTVRSAVRKIKHEGYS